jgi:xanthine dehydrogenase YagR molybdenum-binding subunit
MVNDIDNRVDGVAKVTGAAKYSAEFRFPNMAYGVLVGSTIAKGKIKKIDTEAAEKAAGVLAVITHKNSEKLYGLSKAKRAKKMDLGLRIFHDKAIVFSGQPIALVVAERFEQAQYAASLVKATYETAPHQTDFDQSIPKARPTTIPWLSDANRGDASAWEKAAIKVEQTFSTPTEVHSPMEMHSTTAIWEQGNKKLTVYDKNHAVQDIRDTLAKALGMEKDQVQVNSEFIGGGFGSGLRVWPHTYAAIIAAKMLQRPVKVTVSRPQMFTMVGHRPATWQKVSIGASEEGILLGIRHEAVGLTSEYEEFGESVTGVTKMLYACPNLHTKYQVVPLTYSTPLWMRAPGECTGSFALETAMDELAVTLQMDPVDLRKANFAPTNPEDGKPWSSNHLIECIDIAAKRIGWKNRFNRPGMIKVQDWSFGLGMALGAWGAWRSPATARATIDASGRLLLQSATSDMGPGTATTMVKIAAEAIGIPAKNIKFELGRSHLPPAPGQGGSITVASVGSAVHEACLDLRKKILELAASQPDSMFKDAKPEDAFFVNNKVALRDRPGAIMPLADLIKLANTETIEVTSTVQQGEEGGKYAFYTFAAHFAEVQVHRFTGAVRVSRFVSGVDAGRIMNHKTASSQISGAAVMGIGMALTEELQMDHHLGRAVSADFANYHIPVNMDVPSNIEVIFTDKADPYLNKMGAKGLGEIGLIGAAAAIGNAVYNATGKRLRDLPFTPDKVIGAV